MWDPTKANTVAVQTNTASSRSSKRKIHRLDCAAVNAYGLGVILTYVCRRSRELRGYAHRAEQLGRSKHHETQQTNDR